MDSSGDNTEKEKHGETNGVVNARFDSSCKKAQDDLDASISRWCGYMGPTGIEAFNYENTEHPLANPSEYMEKKGFYLCCRCGGFRHPNDESVQDHEKSCLKGMRWTLFKAGLKEYFPPQIYKWDLPKMHPQFASRKDVWGW